MITAAISPRFAASILFAASTPPAALVIFFDGCRTNTSQRRRFDTYWILLSFISLLPAAQHSATTRHVTDICCRCLLRYFDARVRRQTLDVYDAFQMPGADGCASLIRHVYV